MNALFGIEAKRRFDLFAPGWPICSSANATLGQFDLSGQPQRGDFFFQGLAPAFGDFLQGRDLREQGQQVVALAQEGAAHFGQSLDPVQAGGLIGVHGFLRAVLMTSVWTRCSQHKPSVRSIYFA
jgi:hypothetical protein